MGIQEELAIVTEEHESLQSDIPSVPYYDQKQHQHLEHNRLENQSLAQSTITSRESLLDKRIETVAVVGAGPAGVNIRQYSFRLRIVEIF